MEGSKSSVKNISILWKKRKVAGFLQSKYGEISGIEYHKCAGDADAENKTFDLSSDSECRLNVSINKYSLKRGAFSTILSLHTGDNGFSFFLRDINKKYPVYIPEYKVIVTDADDKRSFDKIVENINSTKGFSRLEEYKQAPEESFENAAQSTRDMKCVTWLGISRDIRIFEAGSRLTSGMNSNDNVYMFASDPWDWVKPKYHKDYVTVPELGDKSISYNYFAGRGLGCIQGLERWLEEGILPVLNARHTDDDVFYESKMFVTLENNTLTEDRVEGTNILVADHYSSASMLTEDQKAEMDKIHDREIYKEEETVIYIRISVINKARAPRYSWVRIPQANVFVNPGESRFTSTYNSEKGYGSFSDESVYMVATLNGEPVPQQEMAVLLMPGESIEYIFKIPHQPISAKRAAELAEQDYTEHFKACKNFWMNKISKMASLNIPEKRIDEMMKAGKLHLDLVCYGNEPDKAVAPVAGVYSPIGSESSPIIQYFDSIGDHELARRAIMYFIEKQHDDGFMQNFGEYMLETGAVLWDIGEHYRYTKDVEWIRSIKDNIIKACEYTFKWIERNEKEEYREKGYYGMIDGKVADPEDPYHSYMLNGFAYIGLIRSAEVLEKIDNEKSKEIKKYADALLENIRIALEKNIKESPVIPLGNGRWCPTTPPWAEYCGPVSLYADGGLAFTHGTFTARDAMTSAMYLLLQEVVDPNELLGEFIINSSVELFHQNNVVFSQPYYSPHPYAHLKRGEKNAFLKEYYNNVSSLADRETYTFWEHYHYVSPHKTHEEAWFLMRSRWMLYLERNNELMLMPGVPRRWLEHGKSIDISGMKSYFGNIDLHVKSNIDNGVITVSFILSDLKRALPERVIIHLPHPEELKVQKVNTGTYNPDNETIAIDDFTGEASLQVDF
jgi:hypothetical protein